MHIMFVCTGNICRSPMGELLLTKYLNGTTVRVSSAGTRGLPMHQIDPSSARLMDSVGIESSGFRSRRLTRQMADEADLILCFEKSQRKDIVALAPAAVRYTFLLSDFANMCEYCARNGMIKGLTIQERLQSVIRSSSMIRPMLPAPHGSRIHDHASIGFDRRPRAPKQRCRVDVDRRAEPSGNDIGQQSSHFHFRDETTRLVAVQPVFEDAIPLDHHSVDSPRKGSRRTFGCVIPQR